MQSDQLSEATAAIPVEACRLAGGHVKFAKVKKESGNTPIEMLARSPGEINHWWWGRIVHDMAGMKLHKSVLTCDYEHGEPIGFLDGFDASDDGLVVRGELVTTDVIGDRTTRILQLHRGGVPFEASIYFDEGEDLLLEYVPEGFSAPVNGTTFEGPGVIAREWALRGVAVCSYGYDKNTQSKFCREAGNRTFNPMETTMSKPVTKLTAAAEAPAAIVPTTEAAAPVAAVEETTPAAPAAEVVEAAAPADPAVAALSAVRAEIKRFRTAFGDKGPVYFDDGLSFEEATARHVAELTASNAALTAQTGELTAKLAKATGQPAGELTTVGFNAADKPEKGGFASKIRFAGQAPAAK